MTTAHRPTWNAAVGGKNQAGNPTRYTPIHAVSRKDLPGMLTLKTRGAGQDTKAEIDKRDLKAELEERERKHLEKIGKAVKPPPAPAAAPRLSDGGDSGAAAAAASASYDDEDDSDSDDSYSDDDSDEDDEEDTAELLRELE